MDIFSAIKDRFIEELTNTVSLHKLFIFVIFSLFLFQFHVLIKEPMISVDYTREITTESLSKENNKIISIKEKFTEKKLLQQAPRKEKKFEPINSFWDQPKSIWIQLSKKKLKEIFSTDTGIIAKISIAIILSVIGLLTILHFLYRSLRKGLYILFSKSAKYSEYIKELQEKAVHNKSENFYFNTIVAINLESQLSDKMKHIRRLASIGETLFSLSILGCLSLALKYYIDFILSIIFLIISILIYFQSYKYYLSDYLPFFVQIQVLKNEPTINGKKDIPS
ncbi:MAG: hypothetical protein HOG03_06505 [Desulfobacula sp.]|jgi:hypothetical protein|uniref:hypothetical protein n=1 Tax=Desulfobacula sp. TaxID=2593537 RepID=UPI001DEFBAA5|nr:hypothetical protein [Desulfobacula sp.]MBT3804236.1 hypothetical protein [Desulfobacula sp.]MBT4198216.1 hypothetical protein [Desulfobacula sp.]MBT4509058.1 hypothetical protein [Desulfobacula sp.]MBT4876544.1 hypothetical protein [Desulfobacula sp.]